MPPRIAKLQMTSVMGPGGPEVTYVSPINVAGPEPGDAVLGGAAGRQVQAKHRKLGLRPTYKRFMEQMPLRTDPYSFDGIPATIVNYPENLEIANRMLERGYAPAMPTFYGNRLGSVGKNYYVPAANPKESLGLQQYLYQKGLPSSEPIDRVVYHWDDENVMDVSFEAKTDFQNQMAFDAGYAEALPVNLMRAHEYAMVPTNLEDIPVPEKTIEALGKPWHFREGMYWKRTIPRVFGMGSSPGLNTSFYNVARATADDEPF